MGGQYWKSWFSVLFLQLGAYLYEVYEEYYVVVTEDDPEDDAVAHDGDDDDEGEEESPDDLVHCPGVAVDAPDAEVM